MKSKQEKLVAAPQARPNRSLFSRTERVEKNEVAETVKVPAKATFPHATKQRTKPEPKPTPKPTPKAQPEPQPQHALAVEAPTQPKNQSVNIAQLRESFDAQAENRSAWVAADYSELIHKLDRLQTEAFILKGKLLAEAKQKFFDANKLGWADFCEQTLLMNYTTANQYIRVALEFDVTSHQYPNLGFEHFKALLPVIAEERPKLLETFGAGSVKTLRKIVAKKLQALGENPKSTERSSQSAKQLLKSLQMVHLSLASLDATQLSAQLKWQLSAACNQVASSLLQFSTKASETAIPIRQNLGQERSGGVTSYSISDLEEADLEEKEAAS